MTFIIERAVRSDFDLMAKSVADLPFSYESDYFDRTWQECEAGSRIVFVAKENGDLLGFVHLSFKPKAKILAVQQIPEIEDLNVLPIARCQGIGAKLVEACEKAASTKEIGLGVGLHHRFGAAQRLYVRLGYMPSGDGIYHLGQRIEPGEFRAIDDYLVLILIKKIS